MTVEQYLEWAERQPEGRYELVDGVPHRMSPEANRHLLVKGAAFECFREAVRKARLDCKVLPDGGTVVIHTHKAREPDLLVVCGSALDLDSMIVGEPVILVEVTSPSTVRTDTGDKLIEYFSLETVQHYLLVHPSERKVVHHRRTDTGKIETAIVSAGPVRFDPPGFEVEVERFFEDLPPAKAH
ncbi:Uma2 family endonuclease [Enterovirga sp. DB1703]|uniref:Uma2 family endonuclease n=2 Tax=Enterovirga aerilata TaxID=2730920 RepID=A0A849HZ28_9HYPH|nr:Uma2 family endonuclease [Enterovirga sp. DB1703]NNM72352.1 Uma2 family endonuclease [Enterovirga sp. DB1703]